MIRLTDEQVTTRKRRNLFIAVALVAFMVAVFMTTFLRMQRNSQMAREAYGTTRTAPLATSPVAQ